MESFPDDFTAEAIEKGLQAEFDMLEVPVLRKKFYDAIRSAVEAKRRAVTIDVRDPIFYSKFARKTVTAELHKRFPTTLFKHELNERAGINRFAPCTDETGDDSFEFLVILDPKLNFPGHVETSFVNHLCFAAITSK